MKSIQIIFGLVLINILITPIANAQNLIDIKYGVGSGSFEVGEFFDGDYVIVSSDSPTINGWTVETESVDWVKYTYWNTADGNYSIDLNGYFVPGCIYTTIPTISNKKYRVSFDISGFVTTNSPTNPKSVEVRVNNIYSETFSLNLMAFSGNKPMTLKWSRRSFEFVAKDNNSNIYFKSLTSDDGSGILLDNVYIEYVCSPQDSDNDGVPDQWDKCPNTTIGLYTNNKGCTAYDVNAAVSGQIMKKGQPINNNGSAMLIQSGEIHQNSILDKNGCFKFESLAEDKPFSVIIRKTIE